MSVALVSRVLLVIFVAVVGGAGCKAQGTAETYAVLGVQLDEVLNVRAEPNAASKKVYGYSPTAKLIHPTGRRVEKDKTPWLEVSFPGGTGWINRLFVTEVHGGGGCSDPELTATIRAFMRALERKDGAALQAVTSPLRGLLIRQEEKNPTVTMAWPLLATLFSASTPENWGNAPGSGQPIVGSFKDELLPNLTRAVTAKSAHETCGKLVLGGSATNSTWPWEYAALTPVSFHFPAADGGNDWITWVAGMEYVDGKPYVAVLVQYQWEI